MSSESFRNFFAYYGTSGSSDSDGIMLQEASYAPLSLGDSTLISQHAKAGFLRLNQAGSLMFATETGEGGEGVVNAFQRDVATGALSKVSSGVAGGGGLCHLNLDRSERWLFAVSYHDAVVSVFSVNREGQLGDLAQRSFRIGHMGSLNPPMVLGTLGTVEAALTAIEGPMPHSGVAAAARVIATALN